MRPQARASQAARAADDKAGTKEEPGIQPHRQSISHPCTPVNPASGLDGPEPLPSSLPGCVQAARIHRAAAGNWRLPSRLPAQSVAISGIIADPNQTSTPQMTLFSFSLAGSAAALIAMTTSFVWLCRRGKFRTSRMDRDEAIDFVQDGAVDRQRGGVIARGFKGKAWGAGIAAEIETREVLEMVRQGRYAEAGPWLCGIFGALGAFLFWPMWVMELCDADPVLNLLLTAAFFVTAVRAAWPRA